MPVDAPTGPSSGPGGFAGRNGAIGLGGAGGQSVYGDSNNGPRGNDGETVFQPGDGDRVPSVALSATSPLMLQDGQLVPVDLVGSTYRVGAAQATADEGETLTFGIVRSGDLEGAHRVAWSVELGRGVRAQDFDAGTALSGIIDFSDRTGTGRD